MKYGWGALLGALMAALVLSKGARAQGTETLQSGPTGDGIARFPVDAFGGMGFECGDNALATWDPIGPVTRDAPTYASYVVISNRAEGGTLAGYALTAVSGCKPIPHKIVDDPAVVMSQLALSGDTRVTRFDLPALGSFSVELTQVATATRLTRRYAITNLEAGPRSLTLSSVTDTDIIYGEPYTHNIGFRDPADPRAVGVSNLDGRIGAKLRLLGGTFDGWRVFMSRANAILDTFALGNELGVPASELDVFARTDPAAPSDGSGVPGHAFQVDHLGDANGDGFSDLLFPPASTEGADIALTVQGHVDLAPGATEVIEVQYEFFGELATSIYDADGDGVPVPVDNCPEDYNPDQADAYDDGIGDACACDDPRQSCELPYVYGVVDTVDGLRSIRCRSDGATVSCDMDAGALKLGPPMCGPDTP